MIAHAKVYLIPTFLDEEALEVLPAYLLDAIKECQVFFAENERSARRYLKKLDKSIDINRYEWFTTHHVEESLRSTFSDKLKEGKIIGILCEAGCPGIADPGQWLVDTAQNLGIPVKPLVGPSSILLALMASGMNGQEFHFAGYLPIDARARQQRIRELEAESAKQNGTQIFIETPYRNLQLLETLCNTCRPETRLCIAVNLTGKEEMIRTRTIAEWKKKLPDIQKKPAIFLLQARPG